MAKAKRGCAYHSDPGGGGDLVREPISIGGRSINHFRDPVDRGKSEGWQRDFQWGNVAREMVR